MEQRQRKKGAIDRINSAVDTYQKAQTAIKIGRTVGTATEAIATSEVWGPVAIIVGVILLIIIFVVIIIVATTSGGTGSANPAPGGGPPVNAPGDIKQNIISLLTNNSGNIEIYKQASAITGVPWQVLAGIHYIEGGFGQGSLVSGRTIGTNEPDVHSCRRGAGPGQPIPLPSGGCGFNSLLDSAIYAGEHLKDKIGRLPQTFEDLVIALSRYNGGGNRNCDSNPPYQRRSPYTGCPRLYEGEDDPYALAFFDNRHIMMYLIYCADLVRCNPPQPFRRPGVATVAQVVIDNFR